MSLVRASASGDPTDRERLVEAIYEDLRRIASRQLGSERADHTLDPTALVHEAYLRLINQTTTEWNDRLHFYAIASRLIRRVLVDHARERHALKRGGQARPLSIEHHEPAARGNDVDLIVLDEALEDLARLSERQSQVVELRYFGGMTVPEVASALDISERTVDREWQAARAWLSHRLRDGQGGDPHDE